jgi:diketogulonate reductase-like aldo/keto reductase
LQFLDTKATLVLWQTKIIADSSIDAIAQKTDICGAEIALQFSNNGPVIIIMNTNDKERH